ncbi:MAG: YqhA family protein [Chloroflexi bacterium]|nr:YqhA family protein [Chloroflexota bacterium]
MAKILENSKYVVIVAVLSLMVAAIVTFLWGAWKTVLFVVLLTGSSAESQAVLALLDMMDTFLIGTVLFIFSLGLYELFIGRLQTPEWLVIDDLGKLKAKLSDVIVVFMAIKFLDKLLQAKNYQEVFWYAASVAVVAAVLIAFNRFRTEK